MFRPSDLQGDMFGGYNLYVDWVGNDSFYGRLGRYGKAIFPDEMFRSLYCEDNGRPCVPPSLLAVATVLQMYCNCSDEEAVERSLFDVRWWVSLDIKPETKPFAKSTLQRFRAQIHLKEDVEKLFLQTSLSLAKRLGVLKGEKINVVIDTTPMVGRGATKDTYGLVADGIKILCRALSAVTGEELQALAGRLDLTRYVDKSTSIKGGAEIDWSDEKARRLFLNTLVVDAQRLLVESERVKQGASDEQKASISQAESLLLDLVGQDTEPDPDHPGKVRIKKGVSRDRKPSATDPEVRHTRKSSSSRSDGHKVSQVVEPESGLVTAVDILPGNAPDHQNALEIVERAETNTGLKTDKAVGDCAFGNGGTRQAFQDAGRKLTAKVPAPPSDQPFHKAHFIIDLENDRVTCPAGQTTENFKYQTPNGTTIKRFYFPIAVCQACPNKAQCVTAKGDQGRTVGLHPQEGLLQEARRYSKTPEFREDLKLRQSAEHAFARGMQLGLRQARYFGRAKSRFQAILVATVMNLHVLLGTLSADENLATEVTTSPQLLVNVPSPSRSHQRPEPIASSGSSLTQVATRAHSAWSRPPRGHPALGSRIPVHGDPQKRAS
jgi:hypothetical protein